MRPEFSGLQSSGVRANRPQPASLAFDNAENGAIVFLKDDKRRRAGRKAYKQYVKKVGGSIELGAHEGVTGAAKGGLLWVDNDDAAPDRVHLIHAYGNKIFKYSVENDTLDEIYDVNGTDGYTINSLQGDQDKNNAYFAIGDPNMTGELYKYDGTSITLEPETALGTARLVGLMENRMNVSGVGSDADKTQYSTLNASGTFTSFAASTNTDGGGTLSGLKANVKALSDYKGVGFSFEESRVIPHVISTYDESGVGRIKDTQTIQSAQVIDGRGVQSPNAVTNYDDSMWWIGKRGISGFDLSNGLKTPTDAFRPLFNDYEFDKASIAPHKVNNWLVITCRKKGSASESSQLIWSFDSNSLAFVEGKYQNQIFWDDVNNKMLALGSTKPQVLEIYGNSSIDEDENIEMAAETIMDDMDEEYTKKSFVNISCRIGAKRDTQLFTFELRVDNDATPAATFTRSMSEIIASGGGSGETAWGDEVFGTGSNDPSDEMVFGTVLWRGFIKQFDKISLTVKEESPYESAVYSPVIRFKSTNTEINSFESDY